MKKRTHSFQLEEDKSKILDRRIEESEKSKSEFLAELVLNALGLNNHLGSSEIPSQVSVAKISEEQQGLPQETQSVMEQAKECPFRAIDVEKNQWYCDSKKIPKIVCIRRQQRYLHTKEGCFPQSIAKHCKDCGREIRPRYRYCYSCMEKKKERKSEKYTDYQLEHGTKRFFGDVI